MKLILLLFIVGKLSATDLDGLPLDYLIGADGNPSGTIGRITEVNYDATRLPSKGVGIKYGNLFDEKNCGCYGPYLHNSDTAQEYNEGQIDPKGAGWSRNLNAQAKRAKDQGFKYIEWDNADSYKIKDILGAIEIAASYELRVIAKNPGLIDDMDIYVSNRNVYGVIVERFAGTPDSMDALRRKIGRGSLPVWFVGFEASGDAWTKKIAPAATRLKMGVTLSVGGEYINSKDIVKLR